MDRAGWRRVDGTGSTVHRNRIDLSGRVRSDDADLDWKFYGLSFPSKT